MKEHGIRKFPTIMKGRADCQEGKGKEGKKKEKKGASFVVGGGTKKFLGGFSNVVGGRELLNQWNV